jgi:hypothetical protein
MLWTPCLVRSTGVDGECMTLVMAKGMQRVALQFWHVGAARKKADREAQEARRRLHQKLFRAPFCHGTVRSGPVSVILL